MLRDNLEPTDFADADCRVTPWVPFKDDGSEYRIWICKCGNHWFQRHEWTIHGKNATQIDPWIYSGYDTRRVWAGHYLPAPKEE